MEKRFKEISEAIANIEGVEIKESLSLNGLLITGKIKITVDETTLEFELQIYPQYPFQMHDAETIKFINKNLMEYNHVMGDGHICIHTQHSPDLKQKLMLDFDSLKGWINKYYLKREGDIHYEHLIVTQGKISDQKFSFLFTDVDHIFKKGEFGLFNFGFLNNGLHEKTHVLTFLVLDFQSGANTAKCKWSNFYRDLQSGTGIFVFLEQAPVKNGRFIVDNWSELEDYVDATFMDFLHKSIEHIPKDQKKKPMFLFIGYRIPSNEIHWQCAAIDVLNPPNYGEKLPGTKTYVGRFYDESVNWMQTKNVSYNYFYGRGALHNKLTESKILIIGVGALGSQLATTLTRGGAKHLTVADFDLKEPENVCRSEYLFKTGLTSKVIELCKILIEISPFVNAKPLEGFTDAIKQVINIGFHDDAIKQVLDKYDIIFDCSTDNDLAYILDKLNLKCEVINLSITNKAKELVCAVKPNLYEWLNEMFASLDNDVDDLYNPTGCWAPTFKASYNDIALLLQQAIQQINNSLEQGRPFYNFILQKESNTTITIKHKPF